MDIRGGSSRTRWMGGAAAAIVLAGLLMALSAAVINGFSGSAQPQDVIRRTRTPINFNTPTNTNTPTDTNTPTSTFTPTETSTPTQTPTPFPEKNTDLLGLTSIIGGSTGEDTLSPFGTIYMPLFDGGAFSSFGDAGHVTFPGAISHLTVRLGQYEGLDSDTPVIFTLVVNGQKTEVSCVIPSKGKGDFCEDGSKPYDNCVEVLPQDLIAVQAVPKFSLSSGESAGFDFPSASWVAKLDLYGECAEE